VTRELFVADGFELVAEIFDKHHSQSLAGASFAATRAGKKVVDLWGGRQVDDSPWRDDSLCVIASGTKGICAVAILMCVERGQIDLEAPIKSMWPEFAFGGKGEVLIGDALAHVAGVPGLERSVTIDDLSDPVHMAQLVAEQNPFVPVGSPSYHAMTFGWIAGELVRRADGRSIGNFVRDEIAGPLKLDLHIGARDDVLPRIAATTRAGNYNYTALSAADADPRLKFVYGMIPAERGTSDFAKIELPGGEHDGVRLLKPETISLACRQRSVGNDSLSGRLLRFGVGFELNPNPSRLGAPVNAFGHTGAGGSTHGAWPSLQTSFSYTMREYQLESEDLRAAELLDALHACVAKN
jgi:CubicO group peptidase (beta-lactamase class C family)